MYRARAAPAAACPRCTGPSSVTCCGSRLACSVMVTASLTTALLVIGIPPALLLLLARRSKRSEHVRNTSSNSSNSGVLIQTKSNCMIRTRPLPARWRLSSCHPSVAAVAAAYLLLPWCTVVTAAATAATAAAAAMIIPSRTIGFCATGSSAGAGAGASIVVTGMMSMTCLSSREPAAFWFEAAERRPGRYRYGYTTWTMAIPMSASPSNDSASRRCVFLIVCDETISAAGGVDGVYEERVMYSSQFTCYYEQHI